MNRKTENTIQRQLLPSSLQELEQFATQALGNLSHGLDCEKAAVYSRVSNIDPHERNYSMEYQPDRAEEYAISKGWQIIGQYSDPDRTGRNSRRPGLQDLARDVKAGKVTVVVVHRLDRLYRNLESLLRFLRFLKRHRVRLVSVTEQIDTESWWGRLVLYVLGALAEMYVWQTSIRVHEIKVEMSRKGLHNGLPPLGYCNGLCSTCSDANGPGYCPLVDQPDRPESRRGRVPVPHPIDQYAVQLIHAFYAQGYSDMDLADYLNSHQFRLTNGREVRFRTRGCQNRRPDRAFTRDSIREIVANPFYAGLVARRTVKGLDMDDDYIPGISFASPTKKTPQANPNGSKRTIIEMNPGQHQPIISVQLWQSNQQLRKKKNKTPQTRNHNVRDYMLTGSGFCWECYNWDGRKASLRGVTGGSSGDIPYYRCATIQDEYKTRRKRASQLADDVLPAIGLDADKRQEVDALICRHRVSLPANKLEEQVNQLVEKLVIPEEWYETILAYCISEDGISAFELQGYNARQELARQRALFKQGHISQAEYEETYLRIDRYLQTLKPSANPRAKEIIPLLKDFKGLWRIMTVTERRALLQIMFAGLYFDAQGQLMKISAHPPFDRLLGLVNPELGDE